MHSDFKLRIFYTNLIGAEEKQLRVVEGKMIDSKCSPKISTCFSDNQQYAVWKKQQLEEAAAKG